jgi:hypothetical protein
MVSIPFRDYGTFSGFSLSGFPSWSRFQSLSGIMERSQRFRGPAAMPGPSFQSLSGIMERSQHYQDLAKGYTAGVSIPFRDYGTFSRACYMLDTTWVKKPLCADLLKNIFFRSSTNMKNTLLTMKPLDTSALAALRGSPGKIGIASIRALVHIFHTSHTNPFFIISYQGCARFTLLPAAI